MERGREDQVAAFPGGQPTQHSPADQQTSSPISEKQSCIWPVLLSADHTPASTFPAEPQLTELSLLTEPGLVSPAVLPRQESNISSQLGKLATSALYLQSLNLAPAVQAQVLSSTSTMTLPPGLAAIPTQHTALTDPGAEMQGWPTLSTAQCLYDQLWASAN